MNIKIEKINSIYQQDLKKKIAEFCSDCIEEQIIHEIGFKFSINSILYSINNHIEDSKKILILAQDESEIIGCLFGTEDYYPFTDHKIAVNEFMRVAPYYRKQGISSGMMKYFIDWAKQRNCELITGGVHRFATNDFEKSKQAMKSIGFQDFCWNYFKRI